MKQVTADPASALPRTNRLGPVRLKSLPESVAEQLRDAILAGQVKPGERLIEQKLAAVFGIGQPTIREALKQLEHQGFVLKLPNRATYVTDLSPSDMDKMFIVRMALETVAIEQAALHMTASALEELKHHLEGMDEAANNQRLSEFQQSDIAFHRTIWKTTGNEFLTNALDRIVPALFAFVLLKRHTNKAGYLAAIVQHQNIIDGLATRDPEKARTAFCESTQRYWQHYHDVRIAELTTAR